MALIARANALASVLEDERQAFGPQIWLDSEHGLVAGIFPIASARFDFGKEIAVPFPEDNPRSKPHNSELVAKKTISLLHVAKRVGQIYEIETRDSIYRLGSATQALCEGLDLIEGARPGTLDKLSTEKKQSKRPVAKDRAALYDRDHPDLHSVKLKSGWYVATNNKAYEALGILRRASAIAGLDFVIRRVA